MAIDTLELLNGISLIIFCTISIYVGTRITLKYFKLKQRELLLVGLTWIFLVSAWYPGCISFIMFMFTGKILTREMYFIIGTNFWPIAITLWMIAFTDLVHKEHRNILLLVTLIYGVLFYSIFYYLLFTDPSLIGYLKGITDVQYAESIAIFAICLVIMEITTGYLFSREFLNSEKPEARLKGKLLLVAFIFFSIGAVLDTLIPLTLVTLPIVRGFEIGSAIAFYMGFITPKWTKRVFIKTQGSKNTKS